MGSDERLNETDYFDEQQTKHFNIRKSPFYRNSVQKGKSLASFQKPQNKMQLHFQASPMGSDSGENDQPYMLNHSAGVLDSRHQSSMAAHESSQDGGVPNDDNAHAPDRRTLHMIIEENKKQDS